MKDERRDLLAQMLVAVSATAVDRVVLERVLEEIIASGPWTHGTFWVLDDERGELRAAASRMTDGADRSEVLGRAMRRGAVSSGVGLVGRAMRAGVVAVSAPPADGARDAGTAPAGVAEPVIVADRCIGVLEVVAGGGSEVTAGEIEDWVEGPLANLSPALGHLLERFRDRAAVSAAEGRLAAALDAGDLGVANIDRRTEFADWTARMGSHHGLPSTDGSGPVDALFQHVHPDDRVDLDAWIHSAAPREGGDDLETAEYRVVLPGDTRWLSTRVTVTDSPGGSPLVTLISADVTRRRRLEEESRRRRQVVEGVQWVWRSLISSSDLDESAEALVHATAGVLGASFGVLLYQRPVDTGTELRLAWSGDGGGIPAAGEEADALIELVDALSSVWSTDLRWSPAVRDAIESFDLDADIGGLRAALVVPVRGKSMSLAGAMVVAHTEVDAFTEADIELLSVIARSAGVAVENARVNEEQRLAATTLQTALLPSTEVDADGVELCVRYLPGQGGMRVGGDWYDVIPLGADRLGVAIGDVCGHGISAAAAMGQFRYSFRALVQTTTASEAFDVLNEMALRDLETTCTLVYAEMDVSTGETRIWSAGHLPPVVRRGAGTAGPSFVELTDRRGPMLGFLDRIRIEPVILHLAPGDSLLLYSDGLVERRGESINASLDRLLARYPTEWDTLDSLCDSLHAVLHDDESMDDDVALVAVQRT